MAARPLEIEQGTILLEIHAVEPDLLSGKRAEQVSLVIAYPENRAMERELLDAGALAQDLPEKGLRAGDLGAVVELYQPGGLEVEVVTVSGLTEALVTLEATDVRQVVDADLIAVRKLERSA